MSEVTISFPAQVMRGAAVQTMAAVLAVGASYLCPEALFTMKTVVGALCFGVWFGVMGTLFYNLIGLVTGSMFLPANCRTPGRVWVAAWTVIAYFLGLLVASALAGGLSLMTVGGALLFASITTLLFGGLYALAARMAWVKPFRTWLPES